VKYGVYNPFTYLSLEDTRNYQQYWLFNDPRRVNSYGNGDNVLTSEKMVVQNLSNNDRYEYTADTWLYVDGIAGAVDAYQQFGLRPMFWDYLTNERDTYINRISIHFDEYHTNTSTKELITFRSINTNGYPTTLNMSFDVDVTNQTTGEVTTYHFTKATSTYVHDDLVYLYLLDGEDISNYLQNDYKINLDATYFRVRNYTVSAYLTDGYFNQFSVYSNNGQFYNFTTLKNERVQWQYAVDASNRFNFEWLLDSVEAFLSFELLPGFKLYSVLIATSGISIFIWFLKMFAGG
jgi:hypothetical protein